MPARTDGWMALRHRDGYPLIEDHGLLGDGTTAALVTRTGVVDWLCVPRFDSPPLFAGLLDRRRGGHFTVAPEGLTETRQRYEERSGVLVTELRTDLGVVELMDGLTMRTGVDLLEGYPAHRSELARVARVVEGEVQLRIEVEPRGGGRAERRGGGLRIELNDRPDLDLQLDSSRPLDGLRTTMRLRQGEEIDLSLRWHPHPRRELRGSPRRRLEETVRTWQSWASCIDYEGPRADAVVRSAITLKQLDHFENGAIIAAATSSLPEWIGGERNWDYRYTWIRDAAFSVHAMRRIGLHDEAWGFLAWVLDAVGQDGDRPKILYDLDATRPDDEWIDSELEGYRASPPVRWGNAAADQRQHDVFGEMIDCAYQWVRGGGQLDPVLWPRLRRFIDSAGKEWRDPDHGIWEVRSDGLVFTYSAALCQVALDRGARLSRDLSLPGDPDNWERIAGEIRTAILGEAWDEKRQCLTGALSPSGPLDAAVLTLPLRRVVPADHPKMVATTKCLAERLGAGDGLILRYDTDETDDGLEGKEGAFVLCSFWLVDNLALQGRVDEAVELYESLCSRGNHVGLLAEQIHPDTGEFLGNFPQAFSHVGMIASAVVLDRVRIAQEER